MDISGLEGRSALFNVVQAKEGKGLFYAAAPHIGKRWIATLSPLRSADLDVLKGKKAHVEAFPIDSRQRLLLQHMLSERKLLASPVIQTVL